MIAFRNVSASYPSGDGREPVSVLEAVDLRVRAGEFVCVLGPSGCGKTTLLNLAAGFIRPTKGQIVFDGRPVGEPSPERAVVFQEPTLFPWLTVRQNVAFGLRCRGVDARAADERVKAGLARVGLTGWADAHVHELSGGMRQRAALARVLVLDPPALLMDEPFGALDANTRERLQDELLRIWQADARTVLFVTHSVEEAVILADRIALLGSPPTGVQEIVPLELARPRTRTSPEVRQMVERLRARLDSMPCCFPKTQPQG